MLKDITLGRYFPGNSSVHKLDPRVKILLAIAYMVIIFVITKLWVFIPVAMFILLVTLVSHIPLKLMLQSLKPLTWILLLMFILNLFMVKTGTPWVNWWIIRITDEGVLRAVFIVVRLVLLVAGTSILTLTTTPIMLTDGLESLLKPLKVFKFPAHELAMMMTIALRFIPTLLDETDRITKAQLSRGADFESGNLIKRAKAMVPIMVPLFVSAFKRADELAYAMDSRCYHGGEGRTRMKVMKLNKFDLLSAVYMCAFMAAIIVFNSVA